MRSVSSVRAFVGALVKSNESDLGSTTRCCGLRWHRQTTSVRVCSPSSRRLATLGPRFAGLTALTTAPRTLVRTGSCLSMPNPRPQDVAVDDLFRCVQFWMTVEPLTRLVPGSPDRAAQHRIGRRENVLGAEPGARPRQQRGGPLEPQRLVLKEPRQPFSGGGVPRVQTQVLTDALLMLGDRLLPAGVDVDRFGVGPQLRGRSSHGIAPVTRAIPRTRSCGSATENGVVCESEGRRAFSTRPPTAPRVRSRVRAVPQLHRVAAGPSQWRRPWPSCVSAADGPRQRRPRLRAVGVAVRFNEMPCR